MVGREFKKNWILTLMLLPAIIYVIAFSYLPMGGIILAFKDFNYTQGIFGSPWLGLGNFQFLFQSGQAFRVTFNTIAYNVAFMVVNIILQVALAVIISEIGGKYFKKTMQTFLLLPFFISWVVVGAVVYNLFSYNTGFVNSILVSMGFNKADFMNQPIIWPFLIVMFNTWKNLGYGSVVYLASISGIDQEMYEAAEIDGASIMQRIFKITIPQVKPTVIVLVLLGLGRIVNGDFGMFYNLTGNNALLYKATDIVDTFVFRSLMLNHDFGMSAAAGVYQSVLGFAIIMTVNGIIRKVQPDYALF